MEPRFESPTGRANSALRPFPIDRALTAGLALSGLAFFTDTVGAQCLSMDYVPAALSAGTAVADIVSGDIDQDGDLDVLTADGNANVVRVLLNNGTSGYMPRTVQLGVSPSALALSDVDSDRDLDLLVGFGSGMLWMRNDGAGQFAVAATYTFPAGDTNPVAVVMADVNEDGFLDAVLGLNSHPVGPATAGGLWVALGDGAGGFQPLATFDLPLRTANLAVADFDGDGHLDAAELGGYLFPSAVSIAHGFGDGTFANISPPFAVGQYSNGLAAGDFDADGDMDIATGSRLYLSIRLNSGLGAFTLAQNLSVGSYVKGVAAGDLDGDGDLDLLATSGGAAAINLVTNDASGHFTATDVVPASVQCYSVMLADTSGDGYPDAWAGDVVTGELFSGTSHCLATCGGSVNYCTAAPNSTGFGAVISHSGSRSIATNSFALVGTHLPPNAPSLFYFGSGQTSVPFGNGFRCVGGSLVRLNPPVAADATGSVIRPVDFTTAPVLGVITAGSTHEFQCWYRNPAAGGAGFNLSDGLSVTFCN